MELAQLAVFVRPPTAGKVKTRLAALFGERGAAELYQAFVEDTLRLCSRVRAAGRVDVALWSAGPEDDIVSEWANRIGVPVRLQPEGDLGVKLVSEDSFCARTHGRYQAGAFERVPDRGNVQQATANQHGASIVHRDALASVGHAFHIHGRHCRHCGYPLLG